VFAQPLPGARRLRDGRYVYGWFEIALVAVIALFVVLIGPSLLPKGAPPDALANGVGVVDVERAVGLFFEPSVQRWALGWEPLVVAANWWYGVMHFVVTAAVFVWLFRRHTDDYPLWRNALAVSAVLALATQAVWPCTPPRLLHGAGGTPHFVDALAHYSTPWAFKTKGGVANQFAAMPSMHAVWSMCCACVIVPRVRLLWVRVLAAAYPLVTVVAIVITGNHYWLDAAGGYLAVGIGYAIARAATRAGRSARNPDDAFGNEGPRNGVQLAHGETVRR
jgi:hypothetical protein